jgi:hypothetical protein
MGNREGKPSQSAWVDLQNGVAKMRGTRTHAIGVLDVETDPFKADRIPKPFCAAFYAPEVYIEHWGDDCVARVLDDVGALETPYLIYCHNGGKFDFFYMLEYIDQERQVFIINGRLTEWSMVGTEHIFRDSMAIIPFALDRYQKQKVDYAKFERAVRGLHKAEILAYLRSDCINLFALCSRFSERFRDDSGNTPISIGQAAIRQLVALHPFERMTEAQDASLRPWYYGGRVQCFASGVLKGPWRVYDVNSMYSEAMASYDHPLSKMFDTLAHPPRTGKRMGGVWFAEFKGRNRQAIPVHREDKGLDFTVEHGTFKACSHELLPAIASGMVEVDEWISVQVPTVIGRFNKFVKLFSDEKIAARESGDKIGELLAKYTLNTPYGKTGQNPADFKDYEILMDPMQDRALVQKGYKPEGRISDEPFVEIWSRPTKYHNNGFYNVSIAASVTSVARAILLEGLQLAVEPIYCDTDSIICREFKGPVDPSKLGAWKFEGEADYCAIAGKKMYCLYNKVGRRIEPVKWASKGGRLEPAEIIAMARGAIVEKTAEVPTYSLSRGIGFSTRKFQKTVENAKRFK